MSDNEQKVPELVANRLDLKLETLKTISITVNSLNNHDFDGVTMSTLQVNILTPFGIIRGEIPNDDDKDKDEVFVKTGDKTFTLNLKNLFLKHRNEYVAKWEENHPRKEKARLTNDSAFIVIKNATLSPYSNFNQKFNFAELILFADQISGITVGSDQ